MAVNRFQQYRPGEYVSQFVPTPLDSNLLFNSLNRAQTSYDNALNYFGTFTPEVNYYHGDYGHAKEVLQDYDTAIADYTNQLLESGNFNSAARNIMQLNQKYKKDLAQTGRIGTLAARKAEYDNSIKQIESIKNLEDQMLAKANYDKNAYTQFAPGKTQLNNPLLFDDPGINAIIAKVASSVKADGYNIPGQGLLYESGDKYFLKSVNGHVKEISYDKAASAIMEVVLSDPNIASYAAARKQVGAPIDANILGMIDGYARATSFRDVNSSWSFHKDPIAVEKAKEENNNSINALLNPSTFTPGLIRGYNAASLANAIATETNSDKKKLLEGYQKAALQAYDTSDMARPYKVSEGEKIKLATDLKAVYPELQGMTHDEIIKVIEYSAGDETLKDEVSALSKKYGIKTDLTMYPSGSSSGGANVDATLNTLLTTVNSHLSENPVFKNALKPYYSNRDIYLEEGAEIPTVNIVPQWKNEAQESAAINNMQPGFNSNNWSIVSKSIDGTGTELPTDSKEIEKIFANLRSAAAGNIQLESIGHYQNAELPTALTINYYDPSTKINHTFTLSSKYDPNTEDKVLGSMVSGMIDSQLNVANSGIQTQVAGELVQESRRYNALGVQFKGNPDENYIDSPAFQYLKDYGISNLNLYADNVNGKNGKFITYGDNTNNDYITYGDITALQAYLNDMGYEGELDIMEYIDFTNKSENDPLDFTTIENGDPFARVKVAENLFPIYQEILSYKNSTK